MASSYICPPEEARTAILEHLYERGPTLPQTRLMLRNALSRGGRDITPVEISAHLAYLQNKSLVECRPNPLGGGADSLTWVITAAGSDLHESTH
jgi:hypothetical protein